MMSMTKERLSKLKCLSCGSTKKRVATINQNGNDIGYTSICCDCGKIETYMHSDVMKSYEGVNNFIKSNYDVKNIKCALIVDGYECDNDKCILKPIKPDKSQTDLPKPIKETSNIHITSTIGGTKKFIK